MREGAGNYLSGSVTFNFNIYLKFPWHKLQYLVTLGVSLNFIQCSSVLGWQGSDHYFFKYHQSNIIVVWNDQHIYPALFKFLLELYYINTKCYKLFTSFAFFPPRIFALFFSHFFFSFSALACSALSIFILFNDYFLCNKEIIVCV